MGVVRAKRHVVKTPGNRLVLRISSVLFVALAGANQVQAGSHLWRIHELFSTADGSVQFIELRECCGADAEQFIGGVEFTSDATGAVFQFPAHRSECREQKKLHAEEPLREEVQKRSQEASAGDLSREASLDSGAAAE
jgi:hypothetical protein